MKENDMTNDLNDEGSDINHLPLKKDAHLVMPMILVSTLFIFQVGFLYDEKHEVLAFIIFIMLLMLAFVYTLLGAKDAIRGNYKSAGAKMLSTLAIIFFTNFPMIDDWRVRADSIGYYIKLVLHEKQYLQEIELTQPDNNGFRYKEFNWLIFSDERLELVYDESGEWGLPQGERSEVMWEKATGIRRYLSCWHKVQEIKSHFYVVHFICP